MKEPSENNKVIVALVITALVACAAFIIFILTNNPRIDQPQPYNDSLYNSDSVSSIEYHNNH